MAGYLDVLGLQAEEASQTLQKDSHPTNAVPHGRVGHGQRRHAESCIECDQSYNANVLLRTHGQQTGHRPFGCICGRRFTRSDTLDRHIREQTNPDKKFLCNVCGDAFHRRGHLKQHLKHGHKQGHDASEQLAPNIEPTPLPEIQLALQGLEVAASTTTMTAEQHLTPGFNLLSIPGPQWPTTPCPVPGCGRYGQFGFLQQIDMHEHLMFFHQMSIEEADVVSASSIQGFYTHGAVAEDDNFNGDLVLQDFDFGNNVSDSDFNFDPNLGPNFDFNGSF
ncbi:hypothetical protein F5Y16DRAFT_419059 [Xylariaceae sp. FL0255]|nr:hypothetical protein F5Y16DRAFT_419059 [Xylariaceae sp. FL0255]